MLDKSKLGKRYECFKCSVKFYDLNRPTAHCPACGSDQADNPNPDPRQAFLDRFKGRGGKRLDDTSDEESDEEEDVEIEDEDDMDSDEEEMDGSGGEDDE
jgi:hypothetical protein